MDRLNLNRRRLLASALPIMAAPLLPACGPGKPRHELVIANWGGDAVPAYEAAYGEPYTRDTGVDVIVDGSGPLPGRIKAMVESGQVEWDVCDSQIFAAMSLGKEGLLAPLDYNLVDKAKVPEGNALPYGVGSFTASLVIAWNTEVFGDNGPKHVTDIFDLKRFPGKRGLYSGMQGTAEYALLADGVPLEKLYPLDLPRAVRKVKSLGDSVVFWSRDAEVQRHMMQGELALAIMGSTRAEVASRQSQGRIKYSFNGAQRHNGTWIIPKGNPAGAEEASRFIASTQDPKRQLEAFMRLSLGPVNPEANAMVPPELRHANPNDPSNLPVQWERNEIWYAENYVRETARFKDLLV